MKFKWPRGRYNGRLIVGISFKIALDCSWWYWKPMYVRYCGGLHWLCFRTWTQWEYE